MPPILIFPRSLGRRNSRRATSRKGSTAASASGPDGTRHLPTIPARKRSRPRLAIALVALGVLVALAGLIYVTAVGTFRTEERDSAAEDARKVSAPAVALCRSPSDIVPVLQAAGLCEQATLALANPAISQNTAPLSAAEVDAIVARVLPVTDPPVPAPNDSLIGNVLDNLAAAPDLSGLDEASTRAVVAGAVGMTDPDPAAVAPQTSQGERFSGLRFARGDDGACRGIVTLTRQDGTTREQVSAAPDGACGGTEPPPPVTVTPEPPPPVTVTPDPPVTGDPEPVEPSDEPEPEPAGPSTEGAPEPATPTS